MISQLKKVIMVRLTHGTHSDMISIPENLAKAAKDDCQIVLGRDRIEFTDE